MSLKRIKMYSFSIYCKNIQDQIMLKKAGLERCASTFLKTSISISNVDFNKLTSEI